MILNVLFFLCVFSSAEEVELPKFSKEVMERASEGYQPNCTYSKNIEGEMVSSCTTSSDGSTVDTQNNGQIGDKRLEKSDGITSDYANEKMRKYQRSNRDN